MTAAQDEVPDEVGRWASCGAMELTGRPGRPGLGPPTGLVAAVDRWCTTLAAASAAVGSRVVVDGLVEVGARAGLVGLRRNGGTTCGGAGRLLSCADGWFALSLARESDVELIPALTDGALASRLDWPELESWCGSQGLRKLERRAAILGLPFAVLPPEVLGPCGEPRSPERPPVVATRRAGAGRRHGERLRVLDLSSLWAGPLCGALLAAGGHDVVKVESARRPDGARRGPLVVFDRLNGAKRSVVLPMHEQRGRATLRRLVGAADVVVSSARPRVWAEWGIDPVMAAGPAVWVAITAHGSFGPGADRVGFGDDAAVSGGLVAVDDGEPLFCADAIADPLTGLVAAMSALEVLACGDTAHLDVSLSAVAASVAAPTVAVPPDVLGLAPKPGAIADFGAGGAAELGRHNEDVMNEWLP